MASARSRSSGGTPVSPTRCATRCSSASTSCFRCASSDWTRCSDRLAESRSPWAAASRESAAALASRVILAFSSASLIRALRRLISPSRCMSCCRATESSLASSSEKTCASTRRFSSSRAAFSDLSCPSNSSVSSAASCSGSGGDGELHHTAGVFKYWLALKPRLAAVARPRPPAWPNSPCPPPPSSMSPSRPSRPVHQPWRAHDCALVVCTSLGACTRALPPSAAAAHPDNLLALDLLS